MASHFQNQGNLRQIQRPSKNVYVTLQKTIQTHLVSRFSTCSSKLINICCYCFLLKKLTSFQTFYSVLSSKHLPITVKRFECFLSIRSGDVNIEVIICLIPGLTFSIKINERNKTTSFFFNEQENLYA